MKKINISELILTTLLVSTSAAADSICTTNIDVLPGHKQDQIRISNMTDLPEFVVSFEFKIYNKSGKQLGSATQIGLSGMLSEFTTLNELFKNSGVEYSDGRLINVLITSTDPPQHIATVTPPSQVVYIRRDSGQITPIPLSCIYSYIAN